MRSNDLAHRLKKRPKRLSVFEGLMKMESTLVAAGFPPLSPWWIALLKAFYSSALIRLVCRVGRRGGKSSTLCRVAVAEVLYGHHDIPAGDKGTFVIISVRKDEAKERLATIKDILRALKVQFRATGLEIFLKANGKPFVFRVYPANFRAAVGMTCVGWIGDEMTRWRDDSDSSNPASDIIASIRPAMATMVNAHEFYISSPWARSDAHYAAFETGNTDEQLTGWAPSWVANPTLTKERCQKLEPDGPTFDREYGAIPMDNDAKQFFDERAIAAAMARGKNLVLPIKPTKGMMVMSGADFAFVKDHSAIVVAHKADSTYTVADMDVLKPQPGRPLKPSMVCARFANVLNRHGCLSLMADAHYKESIAEHLSAKNIGFLKAPTKPASAYIRCRALLNQEELIMPYDESLLKMMVEVNGKPTPSGAISIQLPKSSTGGHADLVSALVLSVYQRRGATCESLYNPQPRGWTKAEMDEVKAIEDEILKGGRPYRKYVTRL